MMSFCRLNEDFEFFMKSSEEDFQKPVFNLSIVDRRQSFHWEWFFFFFLFISKIKKKKKKKTAIIISIFSKFIFKSIYLH